MAVTKDSRQDRQEAVDQILQKIQDGTMAVFNSEQYQKMLITMSKFHSYSVNNCILIMMQRPTATAVAGYKAWQTKFHRNVNKGEKGITILGYAPRTIYHEEPKVDQYGRTVYDAKGDPVMVKIKREIPYFKPMYVFDVEQTSGEPLPTIYKGNLIGSVQHYEVIKEAMHTLSPVPITYEDIHGGANGVAYIGEQRIAVQSGMSEAQTIKTLAHEIAHIQMHTFDDSIPKDQLPDQQTREVEAESVAFVVCSHLGIDTSDYSFPYVAGWSDGKGLKVLQASLNRIRSQASYNITELDKIVNAKMQELIHNLAVDIDQLTYDVDPKEYLDRVADRSEAVRSVEELIRNGDGQTLVGWLEETRDTMPEFAKRVQAVLERLNALLTAPQVEPVMEATEQRQEQELHDPDEQLYLIDDDRYFYIQTCEDGYDYSFYDKATLRLIDGGQLDNPDLRISDAALEICEMFGVGSVSVAIVPLDLMEQIREVEMQELPDFGMGAVIEEVPEGSAPTAEVVVAKPQTLTVTEPVTLEVHLDEYPLPDPNVPLSELERMGYEWDDLIPVSLATAKELEEQDFFIRAVTAGGKVENLWSREALERPRGETVFAISRKEWQESERFDQLIRQRLEHQQERQDAFFQYPGDCYAIYQINGEKAESLRFMNMSWLQKLGKEPHRDNYDLIYTAPLTEGGETTDLLEVLYERFNVPEERPADFHSPSASVSDVFLVKRDGQVTAHFVDLNYFVELPQFVEQCQSREKEAIYQEPTVIVRSSASPELPLNTPMPFSEADHLFNTISSDAMPSSEPCPVQFEIHYIMGGEPKVWKGTQDLNDGFRMLTARFVVDDEKLAMATPEQLFLNNQLVPYLSYHISFSLLERTVLKGETLINTESDTGKAAYYDALRQYIRDARRSINTEATPNIPKMPTMDQFVKRNRTPSLSERLLEAGQKQAERNNGSQPVPTLKPKRREP